MSSKVLANIPGLQNALKAHQKQKALKKPKITPTPNAKEKLTAPGAIADVLSYAGHPLRNQTIISLAKLKLQTSISRTRFGAIRNEGLQRASSNSGVPEGIYPLPALSSLTFEPMDGYLALSNWPIERRLVTPESEGLLGIRYTKTLLELYDDAREPEQQLVLAIQKMALDLCGKELGYQPLPNLVESLREHCNKLIEVHHPREKSNIQSVITHFNMRFSGEVDSPLWLLTGLPKSKSLYSEGNA